MKGTFLLGGGVSIMSRPSGMALLAVAEESASKPPPGYMAEKYLTYSSIFLPWLPCLAAVLRDAELHWPVHCLGLAAANGAGGSRFQCCAPPRTPTSLRGGLAGASKLRCLVWVYFQETDT